MSTRYNFTLDQGATFSRVLTWTTGGAVTAIGDATTNAFTTVGVPLLVGQPVFVVVKAGLSDLATETIYYVRDVSGNTFKLALAAGGAALDLTTPGTITLHRCVDLTGYTARMDLVASGQTKVSLTQTSGITLDATGNITITLSATTTAAMAATTYSYDLELVSGATVTRVVEGKATVNPNTTV